jgi:DNA-binding transcriptional MerR regulator
VTEIPGTVCDEGTGTIHVECGRDETRARSPLVVAAVADSNVEIPNRAAFKAVEVCEIAQIPPYVLRSWEKEFPGLGAATRPGGPRIYDRGDVEQILRIKQLVFTEGLTLAGARRKLEGDPPAESDALPVEPAQMSDAMRERVAGARRELRSLLELLSHPASTWPPAPPKIAKASSGSRVDGASSDAVAEAGVAADTLPLIDGVPDSAPKRRRGKHHAKEGRGGAASNVE